MKVRVRTTKSTAPMIWYENFNDRSFDVKKRSDSYIVTTGPFTGGYIHPQDAIPVETVVIVLPLPPAILSSNHPPGSRGGRFARAAASKRYRRLAREATAAQQIATGPWTRATVQARFVHKQKRRRDDVNHLAMLKSAYDGVVDAGLLVDDDAAHLTTLPATFEVDRESRVELKFERADDL